mgnify:CR=1 FL=1
MAVYTVHGPASYYGSDVRTVPDQLVFVRDGFYFWAFVIKKQLKLKPGETVVFAYITHKSRAHRDKVNAKVMKDKRMENACDPNNPPFDMTKMAYGGFEVLVSGKK